MATANLHGMSLMLVATIVMITQHTMIKAVSADLPAFEILFFRQVAGSLFFLPWILRSGLGIFRTNRISWHVGRALLQVVSASTFVVGLAITPLATVTALHFSAPIFATVIAVFAFGETISVRRWTAIVVGLAGTVVILRPGFAGLDIGALYILLSAWTWAVAIIAIKVLSRTDSSVTITAYVFLLMTPMMFIGALFDWRWPSTEQYGWLVLIGLTAALTHILVAEALKQGQTHVVTPIDFFRLIWATLVGYWLFGSQPDLSVWIGGTMIFASTCYIAWREHQRSMSEQPIPNTG